MLVAQQLTKKCSFFEVWHQVLTCDLLHCIVDGVKYSLVSVGGGRVCLYYARTSVDPGT